MATKNTIQENVKATKNKTVYIIVVGVIVLVGFIWLFLSSGAGENFSTFSAQSEFEPIITIQNIFLDLDGDGDVDYLKFGEVIINPSINGALPNGNFPQGQP